MRASRAGLVGIAVFVVVFLVAAATEASDATCSPKGTALYFGNGVNTTYDQALEIADDDLQGLADEANVNDVLEIGVAYNHTDGLLLDVIQTLEQKEAEDHRFGWFLLNNLTSYLLRGLNVLGVVDLPPGGPELVAALQAVINQGIADSDAQLGTFYDSDVADQVAAYEQDLRVNGYRAIVIAHSQGNLYANASRAALAARDGAFLRSFAIVGVADPAEIVFDGYVTSDEDVVINTLRNLGRTVLPANVHVPVVDLLGHGFEDIYINARFPARAKVVALLSQIGTALAYPAVGALSCGTGSTPGRCSYGRQMVSGSVAHGTQQLYFLQAMAGEGLFLRAIEIGNSSFSPAFSLYDPNGLIAVNGGGTGGSVATAAVAAPKSGTYTLSVYDWSNDPNAVGAYRLYTVIAPGSDACGPLVPGEAVSNDLMAGALDSYTFKAEAGQAVGLRLTDVTAGPFAPDFVVYDPTGLVPANTAAGSDVAGTMFTAAKAGTYTVVVFDDGGVSTAPYKLYFTLAPGANKGGALMSGKGVSSELEQGALDSYTFAANAGDLVSLSVTSTGAGISFPAFAVYDPSGLIAVNGGFGGSVASATFSAPKGGTYTVIVYDATPPIGGTGGSYDVALTVTPPGP